MSVGEEMVESLKRFAECEHTHWKCESCGCSTTLTALTMLHKREIERLQDGYRWLEGLAEGRGITITVQPEDGSLEISSDIHSLYNHVDLKDLCVAESAQAAEALT